MATTTLEKVRRLEEYLAGDHSLIDPVLDSTLDKLLERERTRVSELRLRLAEQCEAFEKKYGQTSEVFRSKYERGELGDEMDYVEWSATLQMLENTEKKLSLLKV